MAMIEITLPSYSKWQRKSDKTKRWAAMDSNFFYDDRIQSVMRKLPDAVFCFQWLFSHAKDGKVIIERETLKATFKYILGINSNRFDMDARLIVLIEHELINLSKVVLNDSKVVSKPLSKPRENPSENTFRTDQNPCESTRAYNTIQYNTDKHLRDKGKIEPPLGGLETSNATPLASPPKKPTKKEKKGTRLPEDWQPSENLLQWVYKTAPKLDLAKEVEVFKNYWLAKSGKDAVKIDWERTFQNWIYRTLDFARASPKPDAKNTAGTSITEKWAKPIAGF